MDNIGNTLKYHRIRNGWTQELVSKLTGLSIRSISRIENGASASKKTVKTLCSLYKIDYCTLNSYEPPKSVKVDLLPESSLVALLCRTSLLTDLQREVVLRFTAKAGKNAIMNREQVEAVLIDTICNKQNYSLSDVISACMIVNQATVENITSMAVA